MDTEATSAMQMSSSDRLQSAQRLPNGARFYRCALQVNPFAYLELHDKPTRFGSEDEYNEAIVDACKGSDIEVIAVTDHYRIKESKGLVQAARNAGLFAFSGFEAVTKDGVHFLCLFDRDKEDSIERCIGHCGVHDTKQPSPTGSLDSSELPKKAREWGAVCIAAHAAAKGGLLTKLSGQSRVRAWRNPGLLACAIPGPVSDAPEGVRPILENKDSEHQRDRLPAILNASDVCSPEDLMADKASCFIKMSEVSVEGLRQAFLDPESRVRLHSDDTPEPHMEFLTMAWEGGFLRDTAIRFNENLNVLVGGRGTGKSTVVESMRYVLGLEPLSEDARRSHDGVVKHVLQSGTKVSLQVRSHQPSPKRYTIERSVPNPPVVKDEAGEVLPLSPRDIVRGVEIFGQHEISDLTKSPERLTRLLGRFTSHDSSLSGRKQELRSELERSRGRITETHREIDRLSDRLATLPGLEETQEQFQQAGVEERLREKSLLVREERLLADLDERLDQYKTLHKDLDDGIPVDTAFVSEKARDGLPNADIIAEVEGVLQNLGARLEKTGDQFRDALDEAGHAVADVRARWDERRKQAEGNYERLLRDLQKSNIDGAEFIQVRQQIERLQPLKSRTEALKRDLGTHEAHRRKLLAEWQDVNATEHQETQAAAKQVTRKLRDKVRVRVAMAGDRSPLERLLREEVGGNLAAALDRLASHDQLSLQDLAQRCRDGKEALSKSYSLPAAAAKRIAEADPELFMRIEELELSATTEIELNIAPEGEHADWRGLQELSTGQKATAVLLLLLLEAEAPLVIDQPEDDLDNRFITETIVPIMRREKRRRQFVFSTHNANIPVLGDAELILGLAASGGAEDGQARIPAEHMASIDAQPVRELLERVLEGGKSAFEMRRSKYGI